MGKVKLLDCTLSYGSINKSNTINPVSIQSYTSKAIQSNVDIIELGIIKTLEQITIIDNCVNNISSIDNNAKTSFSLLMDMKTLTDSKIEIIPYNPNITYRIIIQRKNYVSVDELLIACKLQFKKLIDKKCKIIAILERIDLYKDLEFELVTKTLSELDIYGITISDDYDFLQSHEIIQRLRTMCSSLRATQIMGLHVPNTFDNFEYLLSLILPEIKNNIIIDCSLEGLGPYSGLINVQKPMNILNRINNDEYDPDAYDEEIIKMYDAQWRNKTKTSKHLYKNASSKQCSPFFVKYYRDVLNLNPYEVESTLRIIEENDKLFESEEVAWKYFIKYRRKSWGNKLCIIIPTKNRPKAIEYYLRLRCQECSNFGVDLLIYDSSNDNLTKRIVERYSKKDNSTTKYYRINDDDSSLDSKLISIYKDNIDKYDYIWVCRDGLLVNLWNVNNSLTTLLNSQPDLIVCYDQHQNETQISTGDYCNKPEELFEKHCAHMTILGTIIVSSKLIKKIIEEVPLDSRQNYGMWQPISFFHYFDNHDFDCLFCVEHSLYLPNEYATPVSFWNKNGKALWQWGERWYTMITLLPQRYNNSKNKVLKIQTSDFHPFSIKELLILRASGSLTFKKYDCNKFYLSNVSNTSDLEFKLVCIMPKIFCKFCLKNENKLRECFPEVYMYFYHLFKKIEKTKTIPENYDMRTCILKPDNKDNINFNHKLCIIIPTANRSDIIYDHLKCALNIYTNYGADILIYDSSKDDKTKDVVHSYQINNKNLNYLKYDDSNDLQLNSKIVSLDSKVINAYLETSEYDYIWMVRDRLAIDFNQCASALYESIKKEVDIISIHNPNDDVTKAGNKTYTNCVDLFKDQFSCMTVLGQTIVKSNFIKEVMNTEKLNINNYGLWQPIAFFNYCSNHAFSASSIVANRIFKHHDNAFKGSFWKKQLMDQWIGQYYVILSSLPSIYRPSMNEVLLTWNNHYNLLDPYSLLSARREGYLKRSDVERNKKYIPFITTTPVEYFEMISKMSRIKALITMKKIVHHKIQLSDKDFTKIGDFEDDRSDDF